MNKNNLFVLGALSLVSVALFFANALLFKRAVYQCPVQEKKELVHGSSLDPVLRDGQEVNILSGYYACNEVKRGDVVLYAYAGNENPVVKIVKGIPGDTFALQEAGDDTWHIMVQEKTLANSQGTPYLINASGHKLLSLYINDYQGVIPPNAYLLLGNIPSGSLDSTVFGLVSKENLEGKVLYSR